MNKEMYEACGIDVHKKTLNVHVITGNLSRGAKWKVENTGDGIRVLIKQLKRHGVEKVGFESTGIYWQMLYDLLEPHFDVTLANARQTRALPGAPKTDERDASWIATLLVKGLLKKSYVPSKDQRYLRQLCRTVATLSCEVTRYVNKQHKILDQWNLNFTGHFSTIKTEVCQYLIQSLAEGNSFQEAVIKAPDKRKANMLLRKQENLAPYFTREFPGSARVEILVSCRLIEVHVREIKQLEKIIDQLATRILPGEDLARAIRIPGIGRKTIIRLMAEIGGIEKFETGGKLVAWCGLAPSVYQSAGTNYTGRITKQGNRHVRRILFSSITPCISRKDTALSDFYQRIKERRGTARARVALMAKLLRVLHAVLSTGESYTPYPQKRPINMNLGRV